MTYIFGNITVDVPAQELRLNNELISVEPKVFSLLILLIENRERVVSKDYVINKLWDGRFTSDSVIATALKSLRKALGDTGEKQEIIKTFRGRGFRFIAPLVNNNTQTKLSELLLSAFADHDCAPSIAIMPFDNFSEDPAQEYFVDGICEDVISALCNMRWLFVIARNSTISYKGQQYSISKVAKELSAEYLLTGQVRKYSDRIRVTIQLLRGEKAEVIWSERYDRVLEDVFAVQNEIAEHIAAALEPQVNIAEIRKSLQKADQNLNAWDYVARAMKLKSECTDSGSQQAISLLEKAIEIDATYARAYGLLGWILIWRVHQGWDDPMVSVERAERAAEAAVLNDVNELWAYVAWGFIATIKRDGDVLLSAAKKALEINPNFAMGYSWMGAALAVSGNGKNALDWVAKARRLSPRDILKEEFDVHEAMIHFQLEDFEQAKISAQRAVISQPQHVYPRLLVTASLGHLGVLHEARAELSKIQVLVPEMNLQRIRQSCVYLKDQDVDRLVAGIQKAGLD